MQRTKDNEREFLEFRLGWLVPSHDGYCEIVAMWPTKAGPRRIAHREGWIAGAKFRLAELTKEDK